MQSIHIRQATTSDIPTLLTFIRELAEFEHLTHLLEVDEARLQEHLFGANAVAQALIAQHQGEASGMALYFRTFSTFLGKPGLYLEDLYVPPHKRGNSIGKALLEHLARLTVEQGYGRLEWSVLTWNQRAIDFYESLGAQRLEDWRMYRLAGARLKQYQRVEGL